MHSMRLAHISRPTAVSNPVKGCQFRCFEKPVHTILYSKCQALDCPHGFRNRLLPWIADWCQRLCGKIASIRSKRGAIALAINLLEALVRRSHATFHTVSYLDFVHVQRKNKQRKR